MLQRGPLNPTTLISTLLLILFTNTTFALEHDYLDALHKTTFYLGAQRCGDTKSWMHDACHTRDGETKGVDLSGGWHDCGDHIKFAQTNSFASASMLHMYNHFPWGYPDNYSQDYSLPPANGVPDILDEVKIFTDYLIKAIKDGTVYYQVGNSADHNSFADPAWQSENLDVSMGGEPRPVYTVTSGASNYCGSAAATLALMYMSYKKFDAKYADTCLQKAKEYYEVGATNPNAKTDAENQFYKVVGDWQDDMALGAISLYRATKTQQYLTDAENYYSWGEFMPTYNVLSYTNVGPLVAYDLYKETKKQLYKDHLATEYWEMSGKSTWCNYAHFSDWGSLKYTSASAQAAFLYHDLTNDPAVYEFGKMNIDFILGSHGDLGGDAPENFSFIIGYNALRGGYPHSPQHASAFGKEDNAWAEFTKESNNPGSVPYRKELTGALVGGPTAICSGYEDRINNYRSNEVCTYYNAHIIGALAYIGLEEGLTSISSSKKSVKTTTIQSNAIALKSFIVPGKVGQKRTVEVYSIQGKRLGATTAVVGAELNINKLFSLSDGAYFVKTKEIK